MKTLPILTCAVTIAATILWLSGASRIDGAPGSSEPAPNKAEKKAETPNKSEATEPSPGTRVLQAAREALADYEPIKADIKETIAIGDRRLTATGKYLQGKDLKLRLDFAVSLGPSKDAPSGSLLEVCDGQVLFTRHTIGKKVSITRRDVRQILKAAEDSEAIPHNVLVAELGVGGLPAMLASLEQTMAFAKPEERQIDGQPFTIIEGKWREKYAQRLRGRNAEESTALPSHVPDLVRVFLDKNQFPHRILYLKRDPDREVYRPMVTLDFLKIVLKASVDDADFHFVPPKGERADDITNAYIKRFKSAPASGKPASKAKQAD